MTLEVRGLWGTHELAGAVDSRHWSDVSPGRVVPQ